MADKVKSAPKKFNPASLTWEEAEAVIELYVGAHPKYFMFSWDKIKINLWLLEHEGNRFNGFLPNLLETQVLEEKDVKEYKGRFKGEWIKHEM